MELIRQGLTWTSTARPSMEATRSTWSCMYVSSGWGKTARWPYFHTSYICRQSAYGTMTSVLILPCLLPILFLVPILRKWVNSMHFVISEYNAAQPYRLCEHEMDLLYLHLQTSLIIAVPGVYHYHSTWNRTGRKTVLHNSKELLLQAKQLHF
jgi:hypothetical protein